MDTGTHIVMGLALCGLAHADPLVAEHTATASVVYAGLMLGSQAPDIDTVLKLRNNAVYIRNHRGFTHSIPMMLAWPLIIAVPLSLIVPGSDFLHVWLWTQLAVFLHVFVDIFNSYGTQALRPFSDRWVALGVINTFDPYIFGTHVLALLAWLLGADPVRTVVVLYAVLVVYYIVRFAVQSAVRSAVKRTIPDAEEIIIAPTIKFMQWRIAACSGSHHYVGRAYGRSVTIYDKFRRREIPDNELVRTAFKDPNLRAFLSFSPIYRWEITDLGQVCEVRLIDLRYRSKEYYPFVAVAHIDDRMRIRNSYTGWIFSEDKLRKKLQFAHEEG
ncbi:metal-dependent hydrolase [Edaphobacillus lindanitolerans]|uniref:Inner membrane protein n=1 Tax=Edaphobacillus lindanitolerans TaxID=550447 RepID=A0A1U7PNS7_9BACI|nr:metal-dependent hydrolase [Edaphobacillus lindanitolerans]SIT93173.1 inner membrane protein [Edaphobacillus lindanitolerans]